MLFILLIYYSDMHLQRPGHMGLYISVQRYLFVF